MVFSNVLKIGSDRSVRPVEPSIGHKIGMVQCKKLFLVEPVNRWLNRPIPIIFFLFFKLKRCRFDAFYIKTISFYLELESL